MKKSKLINVTIVFTAIVLALCACSKIKSNSELPGIEPLSDKYSPITKVSSTIAKEIEETTKKKLSKSDVSEGKQAETTNVYSKPDIPNTIKQTISTTKAKTSTGSTASTKKHSQVNTTTVTINVATHPTSYNSSASVVSNTTEAEKYKPADAVKTLDEGVWLCKGGGVTVLLSDMSYYGFENEEEFIKSVNAAKNPVCPYCGSKECKSLYNYYAYNGTNVLSFCRDSQNCPVLQKCNGITGDACPNCGKPFMESYYYLLNGCPTDYCYGGCTWTMS